MGQSLHHVTDGWVRATLVSLNTSAMEPTSLDKHWGVVWLSAEGSRGVLPSFFELKTPLWRNILLQAQSLRLSFSFMKTESVEAKKVVAQNTNYFAIAR